MNNTSISISISTSISISDFASQVIDECSVLHSLFRSEMLVFRTAEDICQVNEVFGVDYSRLLGKVLESQGSISEDVLLDSTDHKLLDVILIRSSDVGNNAVSDDLILLVYRLVAYVELGISVSITIIVQELNLSFIFVRGDHHLYHIL